MKPGPAIPPTRREDDVADVLHGITVADPYRWLEDGDSADVVEWVAAQNAVTQAALDRPDRVGWHERLVALMELPVFESAQLRGDNLFCYERPSGAEQLVLTRRSASDSTQPPITLLDPAAESPDATTAIDWYEATSDGSLIAVGVSEGGTEKSVLRLISGTDGSPVGAAGDLIPDTRAAAVAWEPDNTGFFYTRYPDGDEYNRTVHYHRVGSEWRDDPVIWDDRPDPQAWPQVVLSPDGRWLTVGVQVGYQRTDIHVLDRRTDTWTPLIEDVDALTWLDFAGDSLVGTTNLDAPRGRVVRVRLDADSLAAGPAGWETLVAERDDVINQIAVTAHGLLMTTTADAVDRLHRLDADGRVIATVGDIGEFVSIGSRGEHGIVTASDSADSFVIVDSFAAPMSLQKLAGDGIVSTWVGGDADAVLTSDLVVRRVRYPSLDGTEIGMFLIHRADVTPNSGTPTILYGYGGFTVNLSPWWQPKVAAWCDAGGLYAIANLRGGNEQGEDWHQAGCRQNKQNVFDDFHSAADFLVAEGFTSRDRLAIHGGSNGGLLVGVALTQRPDLCRAVLCAVPLLDMIRFPQFLIAKLWTSEYGDPDVPEEFAWLLAYSPYHHVVDGTSYPATLIQTAEGDTRVDPLHARKMVARLQAASAPQTTNPVLLFQEGRAGHGVGKPVSKRADEVADGLTFVGGHIGLAP